MRSGLVGIVRIDGVADCTGGWLSAGGFGSGLSRIDSHWIVPAVGWCPAVLGLSFLGIDLFPFLMSMLPAIRG